VGSLAVFDDGTGEAFYCGGDSVLRSVDGTTWLPVGGGVGAYVFSLTAFEDAAHGGPALFAGGTFTDAPDTGDGFLSRWGRAVDLPGPYCFGDGSGDACPCGNVGALGHGCNIPAGTGGIELTVENWAPDFAGGGLVDFVGAGFPPMATGAAHLIRSPSAQAPATVFGDGLLCVAPTGLVRINAVLSSNGVSRNAAMHGAGAGTFYYQLWVRSQPIMFCDPLAAFNLSNGVELTWP